MSYIGNSPGVASQRVETTFTATAAQTVFTPSSGYTLGYCDVYQNGVKLVNGDDYTATNGATVTLTTGAASGDSIVIVASFPRGLSDGYLKTESDGRFVKVDGSNNMTGGLNVTIGGSSVLGGATNPVVAMAKGATGYVQSYLINTTNGTSSSADIVAYPNNGTDASGWVDMGITSSSYADTTYTVTGPNEAYLFGSAPSGAGKTGNLVIATDNTGTANSIQFYTNGFTQAKSAAKMVIDGSTGNVGIGTSSPAYKLDVTSSGAVVGRVISSGSTQAFFGIRNSGGAQGYVSVDASNIYLGSTVGSTGNKFAVSLSAPDNAATIDSSGNVGIGTNTPGAKLDIAVAGEAIRLTGSASTAYIRSYTGGAGQWYIGSGGSAGLQLYTYTSTPIEFYTSSAYCGRFDVSGNFVIGTTDSSLTATAGIKFTPGVNPYMGIVGGSSINNNSAYHLYSTGAGAYRFYVGYGGQIYATVTTIAGASDQRLKENIRDLDDGLSEIMALQPRKFDWKEGKGADTKNARGFIAQEFETVFPDLIDEWKDPAPEGEDPYKAVRADLIPVLVKAIQEQQALITQLQADVAALKGTA